MQYLLSEEEYKNLVPVAELKIVQDNALLAGKALIEEIGCEKRRGYCDDCPLSKNYDACTEYRDYSQ